MIPALSVHAWLRWDRARRLLPEPPARVLEIGCGLGSVGALLAQRYEYVGLEPDADAFRVAVDRIGSGGRVLNCTVEDAPPGRFQLVCAFEVLEHMEDDAGSARCWADRLERGGSLVVSVPAGRRRFGPADVKAGHYRRYDPDDLRRVLERAGLSDVIVQAYGFPVGYVLEWGRNLYARRRPTDGDLAKRTGASGRWLQPPEWARLATWAAACPARLPQRPFTGAGTGLVAVGRVT